MSGDSHAKVGAELDNAVVVSVVTLVICGIGGVWIFFANQRNAARIPKGERLKTWSVDDTTFYLGDTVVHDFRGEGVLRQIIRRSDGEVRFMVSFGRGRWQSEMQPEYLSRTGG